MCSSKFLPHCIYINMWVHAIPDTDDNENVFFRRIIPRRQRRTNVFSCLNSSSSGFPCAALARSLHTQTEHIITIGGLSTSCWMFAVDRGAYLIYTHSSEYKTLFFMYRFTTKHFQKFDACKTYAMTVDGSLSARHCCSVYHEIASGAGCFHLPLEHFNGHMRCGNDAERRKSFTMFTINHARAQIWLDHSSKKWRKKIASLHLSDYRFLILQLYCFCWLLSRGIVKMSIDVKDVDSASVLGLKFIQNQSPLTLMI